MSNLSPDTPTSLEFRRTLFNYTVFNRILITVRVGVIIYTFLVRHVLIFLSTLISLLGLATHLHFRTHPNRSSGCFGQSFQNSASEKRQNHCRVKQQVS